MFRSNLCDYSNVYILVKGGVAVENKAAQDQTIIRPTKT